MLPVTPKSATVLRLSSPPLSRTGARGTNSNAAWPVFNEKGAPIQTRPQVQTRAAPTRTYVSSTVQTRPGGTNASYRTNSLPIHLLPPEAQPRPTAAPHSRPSAPPLPPPLPSFIRPPRPHPTPTHPLPLASQSSASRGLPGTQRRLKPPLLAANGTKGVVSLSASQSARNGAVLGGDARDVSPPVTRNAPPSLVPLRGLTTTLWWVPFVPELSGRFADVCVTPSVSHGHGLLIGIQARRSSDESREDYP